MLVQNKGKYVRHVDDVMLVPGANDVSAESYKTFSSNPLMKKLIDKGEIVPQKSFKDMNADEAIDLVRDTFSLNLLEEMKAGEKRKTVLDAITDQEEVIKGEKDPEE